jgi:hypothetical protein
MWRAKHDFLGWKRERKKEECQQLIRGPVSTRDGHGEREGWDEFNDTAESFFFTTVCSSTDCPNGGGVIDARQPFLMSFFKNIILPSEPKHYYNNKKKPLCNYELTSQVKL